MHTGLPAGLHAHAVCGDWWAEKRPRLSPPHASFFYIIHHTIISLHFLPLFLFYSPPDQYYIPQYHTQYYTLLNTLKHYIPSYLLNIIIASYLLWIDRVTLFMEDEMVEIVMVCLSLSKLRGILHFVGDTKIIKWLIRFIYKIINLSIKKTIIFYNLNDKNNCIIPN